MTTIVLYKGTTMVNIEELNNIIAANNASELASFMTVNNLVLEGNTIVVSNKTDATEVFDYWDKRQLVKKINLNS
jgi:hypothetical protein